MRPKYEASEMMDEMQCNNDYKLIDLIKFICAYLVIGIHSSPLQAVSVLLDKFTYYNISNLLDYIYMFKNGTSWRFL